VEREADGRMPAKRIFRTIEEKRKIVEEALKSPHSVAVVARQHGLNSNQLFGWRKLYLNGQLEPTVESGTAVRLLPVSVSEDPKQEPGLAVSSNVTINIELPGRALVSVEGQVSAEIIRVVLESLRG
jgi:transposase